MMDLINYKDTLEELEYQIKEILKEMDYRQIELVGLNDSGHELIVRRSDKVEELLCRDIIYNYLKRKLEEIRGNKKFLEIYGTSVYDAEKQYKQWKEYTGTFLAGFNLR